MTPPINRIARIHHANRPADVTKRTFSTISLRRAGSRASLSSDTEAWAKYATELREALGNPGQLPDNELFKAVQFSDGSNEAFLRRLWRDLYGDEPA
jgi:hypothetical protein